MAHQGKKDREDADTSEYVLRLFITGSTPNSIRAVSNIRQICETYLKGRYSLEIIDVYQEPALAQQEQIIALPLLIKKLPLPQRKLIGDLSESDKILKILDVI
ncbi:circadian clock KaiB family protein [Chitinophaga pinensis]|uniref:KaiB domain protein n=1 Tax=Chitinophaga pinensis (strain ATCC 43595 / DSM 2588 / LMG 13176 / NBRC 15968 / NCIMB 11800 / UQM 2034) TaxID=485918 RepID=A0A979G6Z3_CHIPD|nr:circadian clock KaiB family protein [Chitinophaga pinensis]ACU61787.1 KaiB domain protein [Chitinophaga pinensis DSM 2588]